MTKQPEKNEEAPSEEKKEAYKPKRPRNLVITLSVFLLLVVLALGGLFTALFSHSEDPTAIKIPEHVARSLSDEQPAIDGSTAQATEEAPPAEVTTTLDAAQTPMPGPAQMESQIQLNAPMPEKKEILKQKEHVAPQSMIQWDKHPALSSFGKAPRIAIVIDDMGLNRRNAKQMVELPAALTLSYMSYADDLPQQTSEAAQHGHELMVHMPMEPEKMAQNNPGPDALLTNLSADENVKRLDKNLAHFEGYIGLNNHMGSAMTANRDAMSPVMAEIKKRGLWFLDSRTSSVSVAGELASEMGVPFASRDVFLDNSATIAAIKAQLHQAEMIAQHRGYAVAIGHPYSATVQALREWLPAAQARGFEIVPLSTIIAQRFPNAPVPRYARTKDRTSLSENRADKNTGSSL